MIYIYNSTTSPIPAFQFGSVIYRFGIRRDCYFGLGKASKKRNRTAICSLQLRSGVRWDKLSEPDKQTLERLGDEFTTKEAKQGLSLSARPTNDRLLKWASLGLTEKVKQGLWRKTVAGRSGEQPEQVA